MRPADAHLTPRELESLLFPAVDSINRDAAGAPAPEAQQHLSGCAVCQAVAERYRNAEEALKSLESGNQAPTRHPGCPAEATWLSLAAGLLNEAEAARYVAHAATCDCCGPLLKEAMEDLAQYVTPEEQEALAQLPTSSADWQREMAKKLAAGSRSRSAVSEIATSLPGKREEIGRLKPRATFQWWPRLAWAVAVLALVPVAWFVWLKTKEPDVNQLLAQAYTEQRTIELRMPGAKYGPMRVKRGGDNLDLPMQFYAAEAIIKKESGKHSQESAWLQAQARAHLLQWRFDDAIKELETALMKVNQRDAGLLLDKATALSERASQTNEQRDYDQAVELLGRVLRERPDDPVALFNRAILAEKAGAYRQAVTDWERFLSLYPNDEWTPEAKQRLGELRKRISEHERKVTELLLDPSSFLSQLEQEAAVPNERIDDRIEEYQQVAMQKWLTEAGHGPAKSADSRAAVAVLARYLIDHHGDKWLGDFIHEPGTDYFRAGLDSLGRSMDLSGSSLADQAEGEALNAVKQFKLSRNFAGSVRAQEEHIYSLQMQAKYRTCLGESEELMKRIQGYSYSWLEAQLLLEHAICANGVQQFDVSDRDARRAMALSRLHSFPTLELRILGTDAFNLYDRGLEQKALGETRDGLALYWRSASPAGRGYQLYWNLFTAAENKAEWQLATVYGQEAVHEIALTDYKKSEAVARSRLALAAAKAGDLDLARNEAVRAESIISQVIGDPADPYLVDLRIARAEVEMKAGEPGTALWLLKEEEPQIGRMKHYAIRLHYYSTLGNVALENRLPSEAGAALAEAVKIADAAAKTFASDQERLAWEKATGGAYRAAVELRMIQGEYAQALSLWEKYRSIAIGSRPAKAERSNFPHHTAAIVWALLPHGLATWVRTDGGIHAAWLNTDLASLASAATRLGQLCATPSSNLNDISSASRALYQVLLNPVRTYLAEGDLLTIEADGFLAYVPVQVLESDSGKIVAETHPILYTPSLRHFLSIPAAGSATVNRSSRVLMVASRTQVGNRDSAVVYNADQEARLIGSHFARPFLLFEHKGIKEEARRRLRAVDVFYFVGHSADMQGQTGLVLWSRKGDEAEVFRSEDIASSRLRLKLAVLSACSSGVSSEDGLLDANGLVKAFLDAGTSALVATNWSLDSEVAKSYMDEFYTDLLSGQTAANSLRGAALRIRERDQYRHPYYWAAYQVYA